MMFTPEPENVYPEREFRQAILREIEELCNHERSAGSLLDYFVLEDFGLDVAVFTRRANGQSSVRFFELKAFGGQRAGGVGFGDSRGEGREVDLLSLNERKLAVADEFVRWILASDLVEHKANRYAIFDNHQARDAAMGGLARGKQNNLRVNQLMLQAVTWERLSEEIQCFLGLTMSISSRDRSSGEICSSRRWGKVPLFFGTR